MAVRDVTLVEGGYGVQIASWADLDAGDSGKPVALAGWPDKTIQVIGGTTVDLQGSNDGGTTWVAISEPDGTALTGVGPGMYVIRDNPLLLRPNNVAGSNMSVRLSAK
jgi:hypothetical protein